MVEEIKVAQNMPGPGPVVQPATGAPGTGPAPAGPQPVPAAPAAAGGTSPPHRPPASADQPPSDNQPAGMDTPSVPPDPGFLERGGLRRRLRFLRKTRELAYRDLGGLVFEMHRLGQE